MKPTNQFTCHRFFPVVFLFLFMIGSCTKKSDFTDKDDSQDELSSDVFGQDITKPNIIVILADDFGYEIPQYSGGQSYQTPNLNTLATLGMQFSHCFATPNCCPSRVELLSGKYSFRNYKYWSQYDTTVKTFANFLQGAGYATCAAGKWQFGGGDASAKKMGFNEYMIHFPFDNEAGNDDAHRYKSPSIYQAGAFLPDSETKDKYADDMFVDYISSFINKNKKNPFFIYYAPSLCHWPFQPTPDDPEYATYQAGTTQSNIKYFPSMVKYLDKKVGQVMKKIQSAGLATNTYIIFLGDNGTSENITSEYNDREIEGGKNHSTDFGVHVPMIVFGPNVKGGSVQSNIVDISDIFKTVTDIARIPATRLAPAGILDSKSFYQYLNGKKNPVDPRTWSYCYWKPDPIRAIKQDKHFVQDLNYKLYDSTNSSRFYNIAVDSFEARPLRAADLTPEEKTIKQNFQTIINGMHN